MMTATHAHSDDLCIAADDMAELQEAMFIAELDAFDERQKLITQFALEEMAISETHHHALAIIDTMFPIIG